MSDRVLHCPFLNRTDTRCSSHFSLDKLGHAFQHCFGQYKSCPTYIELLVERRVRRAEESILISRESELPEDGHVQTKYVQLRIAPADRYEKSLA
jgi:hypothetical protein